jgi:hypothetical protein
VYRICFLLFKTNLIIYKKKKQLHLVYLIFLIFLGIAASNLSTLLAVLKPLSKGLGEVIESSHSPLPLLLEGLLCEVRLAAPSSPREEEEVGRDKIWRIRQVLDDLYLTDHHSVSHRTAVCTVGLSQ